MLICKNNIFTKEIFQNFISWGHFKSLSRIFKIFITDKSHTSKEDYVFIILEF